MARAQAVQLNVRSAFAKARAQELARLTGQTATQVVEDALRAYVPPGSTSIVEGMVRKGALLVRPAQGRRITSKEADQALEWTRLNGREDC